MFYDEDAQRKRDRLSQVLCVPVTDFELSVRSRNCLQKMGIRTLGDLTRHDRAGAAGQQELRRDVAGGNQGDDGLQGAGAWASSPTRSSGRSWSSSRRPCRPDEQALLDKPIADLNLSVRARKCMIRLGVSTDRRADSPHGRRAAGVQELRRHQPQRSAREAHGARAEAARGLSCMLARAQAEPCVGAAELRRQPLASSRRRIMPSLSVRFAHRRHDRRTPRHVSHAARRRRDAGLHAGRHAGHRQGADDRPGPRHRRPDDPGQHLSPRAAARREGDRASWAACTASWAGTGRSSPTAAAFRSSAWPRWRRSPKRGAVFRSHIDGSLLELSPERAVADSGSAWAATWRWCSTTSSRLPSGRETLADAVERTLRWAERCAAMRIDAATRRCSPSCKAASISTLRLQCARAARGDRLSRLRRRRAERRRDAGGDVSRAGRDRRRAAGRQAALPDGRRPAAGPAGGHRPRHRPVRLRAADAQRPQRPGLHRRRATCGCATCNTSAIRARWRKAAPAWPAATAAATCGTCSWPTRCSVRSCCRSTT